LHGWKTFVIIPYRKAFGETALNVEARMAELADALDSGSSEGNLVQVQILFRAPVTKQGVSASLSRLWRDGGCLPAASLWQAGAFGLKSPFGH
jgi:hypothetical protein